jgi:lipopolysaccharide transport system permease protein
MLDMKTLETITPSTNEQLASSPDVLLIQPSKGWVSLGLRELWRYRELMFFMTWRDIKVRYKQTVLGVGWAILQPFITMIIFSLVFGGLAEIPSDDVPYPIFSYTALVPWTFFAQSLTKSTQSLVGNANMITKIYFPRMILPISNTLSGVVDFLLAFSILLVMMLAFGIVPTINIIWLPLFVLLAMVSALGVGFWLSAMNVQFRDVRYAAPFLVSMWLWITPVAYPASLIESETLRAIYGLNPMAGVVEGFRWALLGSSAQPGFEIIISAVISVTLLITGMLYFRRMEKSFADVV